MKKNNIKTKAIGTVMAALCVISAGTAISAVSASAATAQAPAAVQAVKGKACQFVMKGSNWNYSADSLCARITCNFTYNTKTCRFIARGTEAGITNAILKAKRADGKWDNTPVRFTVDSALNVTGKQTGKTFITNN